MKSTTKRLPSDTPPTVSRQGHDELNFAEFPLVLLAKRPPAGLSSIEYQDDYTDAQGKVITRKVSISGAGKYGLPTAQDEDVLIALMYLTLLDKQARSDDEDGTVGDPNADRTIYFTRPQLFQILGWSDTGDNYERLKRSLRRWKGVTIVYENWAFLTNHGERRRTDETGFSLLDNYELSDGRSRAKEPPPRTLLSTDLAMQRSLCSITWNKTPFASFQSGYLKKLDLDRYFRLPTAASKRAFRYLDKNLPSVGLEEYDLERFACQHVGFSTKYKPSRLRQDVEQTIVRPLEQSDFIAPMPTKDRFPKRDGRYRVVFARANQLALPQLELATATGASADPSSLLLKELKRHDIVGKAARDLISAYAADHIEQKIDYLDFLIETGERPKKPAGWLRTAIEQDYGPPTGYVPRAERHRQKQAAEQKRQEIEQQRTARRLQEEQEAATRKAERAHIDAYLNALTTQQRRELEEQAVAHADDTMRQAVQKNSPLAGIALGLIVDREVLRVHPLRLPA